ncbi:MAG: polyisoprenoid-binding protein [Bacteroidia bacterium]|nr:polyisoprenoid-binding protein [Bacteroidia bacterium]HQU99935.1 YceI family protein [Bacteroidia bacterium]
MATIKWGIDPAHSEIGFKVRHLMISNVKGFFSNYNEVIETSDDEDFTQAKIELTLDATSVSTGNDDRDKHILSADFLDVANYPEIKFVGTRSENVDNDGSYELFGNLTIRSVTKEVKLDIEFGGVMKDPWGNHKAGINVNAKFNRADFGLVWNAALETGGVLVSDEVRIACEIQLVRQS